MNITVSFNRPRFSRLAHFPAELFQLHGVQAIRDVSRFQERSMRPVSGRIRMQVNEASRPHR